MNMDPIEINRKAWDRRTEIHVESKMYDVEGFLGGANMLKEIELSELPNVAGKRLLHLQCHFGLDTLSWARRGALVTGVDFSSVAIEKANELKDQAELEAKFICSDIAEFGKNASPEYDIVFVSYGALNWLPDIDVWAEVVSKSLTLGGQLLLVEFHPIYDLISGYSYFHSEDPDVEAGGTYTENCTGETMVMASWSHPLGDVINALINAGIRIDRVNEYPFSPHNCFDGLEEREAGRYYVSGEKHPSPLVYSIKGTKQGR